LARQEFDAAIAYYNSREPQLGSEFAEEVEAAISRMLQFPLAAPVFRRDTRRILVDRFPYGIIYRVQSDTITIVAIMHLSRNPEYWTRRKT